MVSSTRTAIPVQGARGRGVFDVLHGSGFRLSRQPPRSLTRAHLEKQRLLTVAGGDSTPPHGRVYPDMPPFERPRCRAAGCAGALCRALALAACGGVLLVLGAALCARRARGAALSPGSGRSIVAAAGLALDLDARGYPHERWACAIWLTLCPPDPGGWPCWRRCRTGGRLGGVLRGGGFAPRARRDRRLARPALEASCSGVRRPLSTWRWTRALATDLALNAWAAGTGGLLRAGDRPAALCLRRRRGGCALASGARRPSGSAASWCACLDRTLSALQLPLVRDQRRQPRSWRVVAVALAWSFGRGCRVAGAGPDLEANRPVRPAPAPRPASCAAPWTAPDTGDAGVSTSCWCSPTTPAR